ncbi:conjugal transfer pilin signal peptidase TrbI [Cupriavidus metallidurans]|jgi:conjugal transfer pilin signal peptidase TrbI|uniref:signal peptidase I n=1 Tax=Cupriavidus TaxID=106589 RepID=UPI00068FC269|nr:MULTISPECIES: signal peptidase I [Cupriavidus]MCA3773770.1 signal peptidase I [Cutibacterium sp.]MCA3184967.1 signal peptidase I [Cupriavidus sp.]MCA3194179.1 signal peptidase I [Cupriavidus sp.]MCA3235455.1 signal peptidase I [Cupriavidus sp.]MDE4922521.1 signal peptidase I [Cupriavidus metallidurans]
MRFHYPIHRYLDRIRLGMKDQNRIRFLRASLLWTVLSFLVALAAVTEFRKHYQIGLDLTPIRCMPERLYWVKLGAPKSVQRGDIIAFIAPKGLMLEPFNGKMIAKQVAGLPGDTVRVTNDRAYVNGKYIGDLVLNQKLGRGPGAFDREEVVPPGKLFVIGTLPRSYDGRYWGFLDQRSLVGSVTPLI